MSNNTVNQEKYLYLLDYASLFRLKLIKEFLGAIDGKMVSDIGCGNGSVSFLFQSLGAKVYSVDVSMRALQQTRSLRSLNEHKFDPSLCQGDAMKLPFREEVFDIVCCIETLEHLSDDRAAIKEIARVAKPESTVILSVPYDARATGKEEMPGHYRRYSFETLKERLYSSQFHLERVVFWCFPMLRLLDLIRARSVFAALGLLIENLSSKKDSSVKFRSLRNHDVFVHSLGRFYRTKFWRRAVLPLLMRILELNKLFRNSPYSNDVFLIFRKAHYSEPE